MKEIALTAADLPPASRSSYLNAACGGDSDLRREIESLLQHEDDDDAPRRSGVGRLVAEVLKARPLERRASRHPQRVGPYRILGVLGEGGMGTVYRAEQTHPLRREVALKLIRSGMDSAGLVARFEVERQILARMEHPNIAQVLDAGEDEDGHPYFVMELVRGVPITEWAREAELNVRERVRLFLGVARAVRHAHQRGVIHRDLKPSNVLVAHVQEQALPKVIDFGVAKAVDDPEFRETLRTRTGQLLGTLEFMSPEQARGDIAAIDVRSDIYSLGALFHELLAGKPPIDLSDVPLHEAVRQIAEAPPQRLCSAGRSSSGRIDGDLETIVGKCLEKEAGRRYQSAAEFAADIERWLDSRPILARPPSTIYQVRKLVSRNRGVFALIALSVAFLLIYGITVVAQLNQQTNERIRAEAEARKAERVTGFLRDMLAAPDLDRDGREVTVLEVIDSAVDGIDESTHGDPRLGASIRETIAITYRSLGRGAESEVLLREAIDFLVDEVGPRDVEVLGARRHLAITLFYLGLERSEEAEAEIRTVLALDEEGGSANARETALSLNVLASILNREGGAYTEEAEHAMNRALDLQRQWIAEHPDDREAGSEMAQSLENLAATLFPQGRVEEAAELVRETLAAKRAQNPYSSGTATSLHNLAFLLRKLGRSDEAEPMFREAILIEEKLGRNDRSRASTFQALGVCLYDLGRFEEAESTLVRAVTMYRGSGAAIGPGLPSTLVSLSRACVANGRPGAAVEYARAAVDACRNLTGGVQPTRVARALESLAMALEAAGDLDAADRAWVESVEIHRKVLGDDHAETVGVRSRLAEFQQRRESGLR